MPSGHFREYILHLTMASRWLHDIIKPSHTIRINIVCKTTTSCIVRDSIGYNRVSIVCPSCVIRVSIGRLRTCFGSTFAFYQIRDENRAKLKISYSCGHRVSKSARYDTTLKEVIPSIISPLLWVRATHWAHARQAIYFNACKVYQSHMR